MNPGAIPGPDGDARPDSQASTPDEAGSDRPATAAGDPLQALSARAAQIRRQHATDDDRPDDWAHRDPQALLALPPHQHPIRRALERSKEGPSRRNFATLLRRVCELLTDAEPGSLTFDDVLAYPWHQLDEDGAEEFHRAVYRRYQNQATRNDVICALRRVVDECHRKRQISHQRRHILFEALYTITPGRSRRRRRISPDETQAMLTAAARHPDPVRSARDTAMLALIRTTGLRSCEVAGIDLDDWDAHDASVMIRDRKNNEDLLVFVPPVVIAYLERWVDIRGTEPGAFFPRLDTRANGRPMTPYGVRWVLKDIATDAGIEWMGSHDFRRTFATEMLELHDAALVSDLLGHRKVDSTRIYDLRGDEAKRAAIAQVPLPSLDTILEAASDPSHEREKPAA